MNLKSISDVELRRDTKNLMKKEVLIGIEVLQHLREIPARALHTGVIPIFELLGISRRK